MARVKSAPATDGAAPEPPSKEKGLTGEQYSMIPMVSVDLSSDFSSLTLKPGNLKIERKYSLNRTVSVDLAKNISNLSIFGGCSKENKSTFSTVTENIASMSIKDEVDEICGYLLRRTKRFHEDEQLKSLARAVAERLKLGHDTRRGIKRKRGVDYPVEKSKSQGKVLKQSQSSTNCDVGGFAIPKIYPCGYCPRKYHDVAAFCSHIRRHMRLPRCVRCHRGFQNVCIKKRHERFCSRKLRVK